MLMGLLLGLVGVTSKENAVLILPLAFVVEYTLFSKEHLSTKTRFQLKWFYVFTIGVPLLIAAFWIALDPTILLKTYDGRDFDLLERLLTQTRVLWFYLYLFAIPRLSNFSLFHDDIIVSHGLFEPISTFFSILGIIVLMVTAIRLRKRFPIVSFGIAWFFISHALESSIVGLELMHEHRNYLASFGVMLILAYGIGLLATKFPRPAVPLTTAICLMTLFSFITSARATAWSNEKDLIQHTLKTSPRSPRSHVWYGDYLLRRNDDPRAALDQFVQADQLNSREPAYLMAVQLAAMAIAPRSSKKETGYSDSLQLQPPLSQRVSTLLKEKPASPMAVSLLVAILDRILESPKQPENLVSTTTNWAFIAANNPRLPETDRQDLLVRLADIYIARKNYREALRSAFVGITNEPDQANYHVMAADVLLLMNRCHAAQSHVEAVLGNPKNPDDEKVSARTILKKIERRHSCLNAPKD